MSLDLLVFLSQV